MKTVATVVGIRPDFIRMSEVFRLLDKNYKHVLIHTGQHFTENMSDVFFSDLQIRPPDINLQIGRPGLEHYDQLALLAPKLVGAINKIKPDITLFLGDSNSVCASLPLKKEGHRIGHIEAGMRSGDRRMLEEINRIVCDNCSDVHFVYHDNYKVKLIRENIPGKYVYVVGNTIKEVFLKNKDFIPFDAPTKDFILVDIHRPENFKYEDRLRAIIKYIRATADYYRHHVKWISFGRADQAIARLRNSCVEIDKYCSQFEFIPPVSFKEFIALQYNANVVVSDSGTSQEETCLVGTKVVVPRDFTERPESVENNCSYLLKLNDPIIHSWNYIDDPTKPNTDWLGDGNTAANIVTGLEDFWSKQID